MQSHGLAWSADKYPAPENLMRERGAANLQLAPVDLEYSSAAIDTSALRRLHRFELLNGSARNRVVFRRIRTA